MGAKIPFDAYSSGSAYTLTTTPAALVFGTTSPQITLTHPGAYRITANVQIEYNAATFALNRTVTLTLRRTNNTPADLAGGSCSMMTGIVTLLTDCMMCLALPDVWYTTNNSDDVLTIFGSVSNLPTAGSLDCSDASIHAQRYGSVP